MMTSPIRRRVFGGRPSAAAGGADLRRRGEDEAVIRWTEV